MNKILCILLFGVLTSPILCCGQEIDWKTTSNWKLYNIHNKAGFKYPVDSLTFFKSVRLDDASMASFLVPSSIWPKEKTSLWMGLFVASFETPGKEIRKIIISSYGGFFYDPAGKRYYELKEGDRNGWYQFINDNAAKLDAQ
ncbi:MAG: hypothetical protein ABIN94_07840 [Ferruginibacter sp.]